MPHLLHVARCHHTLPGTLKPKPSLTCGLDALNQTEMAKQSAVYRLARDSEGIPGVCSLLGLRFRAQVKDFQGSGLGAWIRFCG